MTRWEKDITDVFGMVRVLGRIMEKDIDFPKRYGW